VGPKSVYAQERFHGIVSKGEGVGTLDMRTHRRRKWGRRGRARGPNILARCRFGAAGFFDRRVVCFITQTQIIAYPVVHVSRFQWFDQLVTRVASY